MRIFLALILSINVFVFGQLVVVAPTTKFDPSQWFEQAQSKLSELSPSSKIYELEKSFIQTRIGNAEHTTNLALDWMRYSDVRMLFLCGINVFSLLVATIVYPRSPVKAEQGAAANP